MERDSILVAWQYLPNNYKWLCIEFVSILRNPILTYMIRESYKDVIVDIDVVLTY